MKEGKIEELERHLNRARENIKILNDNCDYFTEEIEKLKKIVYKLNRIRINKEFDDEEKGYQQFLDDLFS